MIPYILSIPNYIPDISIDFIDSGAILFKFLLILVNMGICSMPFKQMRRYNKIHFAIISFKLDCIYVFKYIFKNRNNKVGLHNLLLSKLT